MNCAFFLKFLARTTYVLYELVFHNTYCNTKWAHQSRKSAIESHYCTMCKEIISWFKNGRLAKKGKHIAIVIFVFSF